MRVRSACRPSTPTRRPSTGWPRPTSSSPSRCSRTTPDDARHEGVDPMKKAAVLACCAIGPSFGAFERMAVNAFDTVLVTGAGPVGLGAVVNAAFRNARVFVAESVPYRTERAKSLGAEAVFDPKDPEIVAKIR